MIILIFLIHLLIFASCDTFYLLAYNWPSPSYVTCQLFISSQIALMLSHNPSAIPDEWWSPPIHISADKISARATPIIHPMQFGIYLLTNVLWIWYINIISREEGMGKSHVKQHNISGNHWVVVKFLNSLDWSTWSTLQQWRIMAQTCHQWWSLSAFVL